MTYNNCKCKICGKEFHLKPSAIKKGRGKCCSKTCSIIAQNKIEERLCLTCDGSFMITKNNLRKFCSRQCYAIYKKNNQLKIICGVCKKEFVVCQAQIKRGKKFCSEECQYGAYRNQGWRAGTKMTASGINNSFWRGGRMLFLPLVEQIRKLPQYIEWRNKVYSRDNYTCLGCGKRGGRLEVNHIIPFSYIIFSNHITTIEQALICEELWDINNGETLCHPCHVDTDTYGYKALIFRKEVL